MNTISVDVETGKQTMVKLTLDPEDIEYTRSQQLELVNEACAIEIVSGVWSEAVGSRHKYDNDVVDQLNLQQAYTMAQITGQSVQYRVWNEDGTKSFYPHTAQQFEQVFMDGAVIKLQLLQKCATLKGSILSATSTSAILDINW